MPRTGPEMTAGAIKEKDRRNYLPGPSLCFRFSSAIGRQTMLSTGAQPGRAGLHGIPLGPTEPASYPRAAPPMHTIPAGENGDAVYVTRAQAHPPATTVPGVSKIPGSSFCPYFRACQRCRAYHGCGMVDGLRCCCCQSVNSRFPRRSGLRSGHPGRRSGRGYTPRGPRKRFSPGRRSTA